MCVCTCVWVRACVHTCIRACVRAQLCLSTACINPPSHVPLAAVQFPVSLHDTSAIRSPLGNLNPLWHVYLAVCPNVVRLNFSDMLGSSCGCVQLISETQTFIDTTLNIASYTAWMSTATTIDITTTNTTWCGVPCNAQWRWQNMLNGIGIG